MGTGFPPARTQNITPLYRLRHGRRRSGLLCRHPAIVVIEITQRPGGNRTSLAVTDGVKNRRKHHSDDGDDNNHFPLPLSGWQQGDADFRRKGDWEVTLALGRIPSERINYLLNNRDLAPARLLPKSHTAGLFIVGIRLWTGQGNSRCSAACPSKVERARPVSSRAAGGSRIGCPLTARVAFWWNREVSLSR